MSRARLHNAVAVLTGLVLVITYRDVVKFGDRIWSALTGIFS